MGEKERDQTVKRDIINGVGVGVGNIFMHIIREKQNET